MGDRTGIEWTDATWNPLRGCSRVSEGCRNCYAESVAARFSGLGQPYDGLATLTKAGPRWTGVVRTVPDVLDQPLRWTRPRMIFVNSMSDLFHERVEPRFVAAVFGVMALARQHVFQVLTKRADRMRDIVNALTLEQCVIALARDYKLPKGVDRWSWLEGQMATNAPWPLPNVALGVSAEDQLTANERVPSLLATRAAVRWISAEPLLGPIDFTMIRERPSAWPGNALPHLDWIVTGGESGAHARPCASAWVRAIRDDCDRFGVAFFHKQWGEWYPINANPGASMAETPAVAGQITDRFGEYFTRTGKKRAGNRIDGERRHGYPGQFANVLGVTG